MTQLRCGRALRLSAALLAVLLLGGCAMVAVKPQDAGAYIAAKRGDVLSTGEPSAATRETIRVAGVDTGACKDLVRACVDALTAVEGISEERRLSALSELWLHHAIQQPGLPSRDADDAALAQVAFEARFQAWMEVARHAYAYLFFTARTPGERAFEDRQTQVRDYYNAAVEQATTMLFQARSADAAADIDVITEAGWTLRVDMGRVRLPEGQPLPQQIVPASSLTFQGLRSIYRRDGFGAELVAVMADDPVTSLRPPAPDDPDADTDGEASEMAGGHDPQRRRQRRGTPPAWSEMPSPTLTVLLRFAGDDLASVLATREALLSVHDPYVDHDVSLQGQDVPLAANFTAGYGLWLARSGFATQSLRTLFGREQGIDHPHLYMMQPWDPDRRIILMLHGLASSPEAWVNVANELLGDETLRRNYQIWQVYYPTNLPIAFNHSAIRRLTADALRHFDPAGTSAASRDMVLVGHSMGGVIARLMVSTADDQLWDAVIARRDIDPARLARVRPRIEPILRFQPFPPVERAIFIAAPHRGTLAAGNPLGRWISRLVRLPLTILEGFDDVLQALAGSDAAGTDGEPGRIPNSIDNLSHTDPFIQAASDLPISPRVGYHSIIAHRKPAIALADSDDGLVPYASAHLPGALSEKVIVSGHSVQETAAAILEVRRILHRDLRDYEARRPAPP